MDDCVLKRCGEEESRMRRKGSFLLSIFFAVAIFFCAAGAWASNPVPHLDQPLAPDSVAPGTTGVTLTINGTGFVGSSTVKWNGTILSTTFVSSVQLTASVPATKLVKVGTASITVINPAPGGGASNVVFFQVVEPSPAVGFFRSDLSLPSTSESIGVIAADFNNDGKLDIATANVEQPGLVFIFLGNGDGTFQPAVSYSTGQEPYSLAAGDFNGDGIIDLAVANFFDNTVSVLLGNGDGTFQTHIDYATGTNPDSVMCGDFNGDGKLDLVVSNYSGSLDNASISILLGNGDGTFQPHVDYPDPVTNPFSLNIGDFNGDGKLDVVMATDIGATSGVAVFLGNGDGTFQAPVGYATASSSISVEVADFNGDGKLDLAVGTPAGVSILLGNGDGTFQSYVDYGAAIRIFSLVAGDLNGDGKLDLAFTDLDTNQISVMLGNGDGTFQSAIQFGALLAPFSLTKGDFNQDGSLDLAIGYEAVGSASVLLGTAANLSTTSLVFGPQTIHTTSAGQNIVLSNTGGSVLSITSVKAAGNFSQTNTCGNSLAIGASCTITVTFTPPQQGPQAGRITIVDSAHSSPQIVSLSGVGTVVSLSHWSLAFPPEMVGVTSPPLSTTLTNVGNATIDFMGWSITGTNHKDFTQTDNCGFSLAPGQSCTFRVTFTPGAKGSRTASLNLYDGGGGSPQIVALSGTGR
jgi:hypothetical protein